MNKDIIRDRYKPLRNAFRKISLVQLFVTIWYCAKHIEYNHSLPSGFARFGTSLHGRVHVWDLLQLAKEGVMNCNEINGRDVVDWKELSSLINKLNDFKDEISKQSLSQDLFWAELHRLANLQFVWQNVNDINVLMRYYYVYSGSVIRGAISELVGVELEDLIAMGLAVSGHFLNMPFMDIQGFKFFEAEPVGSTEKFFSLITSSFRDFKLSCTKNHSFSDQWVYEFNPIVATPLVALYEGKPARYFCPAPFLITRSIAHGIYYHINKSKGFDSAFGDGFDRYIGMVIDRSVMKSKFSLIKPDPYLVHGSNHHGADWVLVDATGNLFIECKTKRLKLSAKTELGGDGLDSDLKILAEAVVQIYKNILEALQGMTNWVVNKNPIYPLVVTLEDWYLISYSSTIKLDKFVRDALLREQMDVDIVKKMPFSIMSAKEAETLFQVIDNVSIDGFFVHRRNEKYSRYLLKPMSAELFGKVNSEVNQCLFKCEFESMIENTVTRWSC